MQRVNAEIIDEVSSVRIVLDATDITQDVPSKMNNLSLSYSNYKSPNTRKAITCVPLSIVLNAILYPPLMLTLSITVVY